ncbi:MAG TPA: hypothetical protein VG297_24520 [Bryobacteraceae bacterium]|nr:hypothetical protein [Bryobacteraceae bacterium]
MSAGALFAGAGGHLLAASGFWNKKDPAEWTSDEILQLATRSPWATKARVLPKPGRDKGSTGTFGPDVGGGRGGGRGTGPEPLVAVQEVTVVWESAPPLVDVLRTTFPSDFSNHYVIGVHDLPATAKGHGLTRENLSANLAKGHDSVDAGAIDTIRGRTVLIFGFSKELLPLGPEDKEVTFSMATEAYSVRARFDLKEMRYRGMLAV